MKTLKILLDTSVYSAMLDKRDPIRQKQTQDFWRDIDKYELFFSTINKEEIEAIKDEKLKNRLKNFLIKGKELEITEEVEQIKSFYIKEELIPEKYENDALFLALTTVHSIDILISWNFKHLVKRKTRIGVNLINLKEGYKPIEILAPPEV
jgi:predicted nucleic acid-binding protein